MAAPFLVDFETVLEIRKPEFVHFYEKKPKHFTCNCLDILVILKKLGGGGFGAIEETFCGGEGKNN